MYVCMFVCLYTSYGCCQGMLKDCVCMYVCMYVCMQVIAAFKACLKIVYVCMYVRTYLCMYVHMYTSYGCCQGTLKDCVGVYVCMYICTYVYKIWLLSRHACFRTSAFCMLMCEHYVIWPLSTLWWNNTIDTYFRGMLVWSRVRLACWSARMTRFYKRNSHHIMSPYNRYTFPRSLGTACPIMSPYNRNTFPRSLVFAKCAVHAGL